MFEDLEDDEFMDEGAFADEPGSPEEEGSNRTFVIAAIALGVLGIVAIICVGIYLFSQAQGGNRAAQMTEQANAFAQQTQEALAVQQTIEAQSFTATPTNTAVPTETSTPTAVVVLPTATAEDRPTDDPATATVAALLTQAAGQPTQDPAVVATITVVVTGLPNTGIFDDFGVSGLILLAFFALVVIFLARRMRAANR